MSKTLLRHTLIKKYFWHFSLLPYLYTFSLYENASFIIVSAETEYISTRSRSICYTLRFYFPYLSLLAQPVTIFVYGPVVYMDRPGTCIILDKKYNIVNSSKYGPIKSCLVYMKSTQKCDFIAFFFCLYKCCSEFSGPTVEALLTVLVTKCT